jgi:hypothetical protein
MIIRLSTRLITRAMKNIAAMLPKPRGTVTNPVVIADSHVAARRQQRRGSVMINRHIKSARDEIGASTGRG